MYITKTCSFRKIPSALITVMLISISAMATVQAQETPQLSLQQAEKIVLAKNPALAAMGRKASAMANIPEQAGSLADPVISLKSLNLPVDSFSTTQENMTQLQLGFSQAIPFPGKLALKYQYAKLLATTAMQNEQEFRLLLLRNTRIHWWNIAYLDKAHDIIHHNQELLRNLVKIAETKYKTGKGLQQDVLLAQLELSKLLEREMNIHAARNGEVAALNALLARPANSPVKLAALPTHPWQALTTDIALLKHKARHNRPILQALQTQVQAADTMLKLAEKDYYPDFTLGAAYGLRQGSNPVTARPRSDFASFMFSMSLPIYSAHKQDKAIDQRMAEKEKARFTWLDRANQVDAEIETAISDLRIAHDQVQLFEEGILPQARQTTASMLAGYQVNKVDFLNLVRAQLNEFNTDIQYWKQISLAHQAEARLSAAVGQENINFEDSSNHE